MLRPTMVSASQPLASVYQQSLLSGLHSNLHAENGCIITVILTNLFTYYYYYADIYNVCTFSSGTESEVLAVTRWTAW